MAQERISVRGLVEFTLHGEDILPGGSIRDMQEGTQGHKARQADLPAPWESEVPLSITCTDDDDAELLVTGRMDAFCPGEIPVIEEIKLCQSKNPPAAPYAAHEAQAACYAHILCETRGIAQVTIRVAYVDTAGRVKAKFEQTSDAETYRERFMALLLPYMRRLRILRRHAAARNASLQALRFPFGEYRPGQREMAVQVYTAIRLGRRLFAQMPTGTGKSAAALFPALKALGSGLTGQVYYLTARTTQRQGPLEAIARMRRQPLHLWVLTLDAKDRQCPNRTICHPDYCPRARGHFQRDGEAIDRMMAEEQDWTPDRIRAMADEYMLCPFEFSLSLAEAADVTVCDYNYALDPAVHIQRIFDRTGDVTLLIDEAHNLSDRVRDMLGGGIDGARIRKLRTAVGKTAGRKHGLYKAMTRMLNALTDLPVPEDEREGELNELPQSIDLAAEELCEAFLKSRYEKFDWESVGERLIDTTSALFGFLRARRREPEGYAWIWQGGVTSRRITALALDISGYLSEVTAPLQGIICFSATLQPMEEMKTLLGGGEEDACFSMPSPFPPENLLVLQEPVNTRYAARQDAVPVIADRIRSVMTAHPGKYMVFFPSFAFLRMAEAYLDDPSVQTQYPGMTAEDRESFLAPYVPGGSPVTSLCVMGGVFSEGIDLPGDALDGVIIVGVGLPQVNLFREVIRRYYDETMGAGFQYAYRIPGMQKVAQAVGRVIRTETDRGIVLLLDDRYTQTDYRALCPPQWQWRRGETDRLLREFWQNT